MTDASWVYTLADTNWTYATKYPNLIVVKCTKCSQSWELNNPLNPDPVMHDLKLKPGDEMPKCTCRVQYGFGVKREAYMQVILSIIEHNDAETISLTKTKIKDMMRAITDFSGNDKYLYQNSTRSQKSYKYSDAAWALKDAENNQPLRGDHCVPLNSIITYLVKEKESSTFSRDEIERFLDYHLEVVMITKEEDKILSSAGLKSKMPMDWEFYGDKYARYKILGINIALESVLNSLKNHT